MNERIHHLSSGRKPDMPMGPAAFDDTLAMIAPQGGRTDGLSRPEHPGAAQAPGHPGRAAGRPGASVNDYYQLREQSQDGHRRVVALNKEIQGLRSETLMRQVEAWPPARPASMPGTAARPARRLRG